MWVNLAVDHQIWQSIFVFAFKELFKVTHLMGAEAWDFLLKCTALTQKCDALTSKDLDTGRWASCEFNSNRGSFQRVLC